MGQFLFFLFSPGSVVSLLAISAFWLWRRPSSKPARRLLLTVSCIYTISSIYVFPATVARLATRAYHRFEPGDLPPGGDVAVVLLGAGGYTVVGWEDRVPIMTPVQASRVIEAWRVIRTIKPTWIVSSGGSPDPRDERSSGIVLRDELLRLGAPAERVLVETTSLNTHDEAVILGPMLRSHGVKRVVLVTSDVHMRRSLGAFRAEGVTAVPAIAPDPRIAGSWFDWLVPNAGSLSFTAELVHEFVGLPYYWVRGWWRP